MTIKLMTWNANGLKPKITELRAYLQQLDLDIALINETKMTNEDKLRIKDYQIIRNDRTARGGGVAIIIKNCIPFKEKQFNTKPSIESICIQLQNKMHIVAVYNRPSNKFTPQDLDILTSVGDKVLIVGDLNARHITWKNHTNNSNGNTLYTYTTNNNITILHTTDPTHFPVNNMTPTYVDILINKNVQDITKPISSPALTSDHNPILFQIKNINKENHKQIITSYKSTDWKTFKQELDNNIKIKKNILSPHEIDDELRNFTNVLIRLKQKHTKQISINPYKDELTDEIKDLIQKRNRMRKTHQDTRNPNIKNDLNRLNRTIKFKIQSLRNSHWNDKLKELSPKDNTLWQMTKILKKPKQPIPTLVHNNVTYYTDKQKANAIATVLETTQSNTTHSPLEPQVSSFIKSFQYNHTSLDPKHKFKIQTSPREIKNIIKILPNNKSPGLDGLDNKILKNLTSKAIVQLMHIINAILITGHFPDQWKQSVIVPIPKNNKDLTNPNNYRPISLLSSLSKLAERVILLQIKSFERRNEVVIDEQFGFRAGHSTSMQTARIACSIKDEFLKHKVTSMCLLDIEKAFDTVWLDGLVYKLIKLDFPQHLIQLISSYLENRQFSVRIGTQLSENKTPKAGVPQGSVLGPVLFNYFINDIPKFSKTQMAIYADDTAILASSFNAQVATSQIQIHLNQILNFTNEWKIKLNESKTEHILFSRKFTNTRITTPLQINRTKIETKHNVKYLGVVLDSKLYFKPHMKLVSEKVNLAIRTLYPLLNKKSPMSIQNKKLLYTAIIRPLISYAAPVWCCDISNTSLLHIQRLQNRCLRLVLSKDRYTSTDTLHRLTNLPTIRQYITQLTQKLACKSLHNSTLTKHLVNKFKNLTY